MSEADLQRFVGDVQTDVGLQEALKRRVGGAASLVEVANSHGYDFTIDEIRDYVRRQKGNLTETQLDEIVAGVAQNVTFQGGFQFGFLGRS
jgi:predicted ribosomally synthesized peptide with nif11-like leader